MFDTPAATMIVCCECGEAQKGVRSLEAHLSAVHLRMLQYACASCEFVFLPSEDALVQHTFHSHGQATVKIDCTVDFEKKQQLSNLLDRCINNAQLDNSTKIAPGLSLTTTPKAVIDAKIEKPPTPGPKRKSISRLETTAKKLRRSITNDGDATAAAVTSKDTVASTDAGALTDAVDKTDTMTNILSADSSQMEDNDSAVTENISSLVIPEVPCVSTDSTLGKNSNSKPSRSIRYTETLSFDDALVSARQQIKHENNDPINWERRFAWIHLNHTLDKEAVLKLKGTISRSVVGCNTLSEFCATLPSIVSKIVLSTLTESGKLKCADTASPEQSTTSAEAVNQTTEAELMQSAKRIITYAQNLINNMHRTIAEKARKSLEQPS